MSRLIRLAQIAALFAAGPALAQAPAAPPPAPLRKDVADAAKERAALTNLSVPDIPAFSFLGAAPTTIARPSGARALGAALLQGIDGAGKAKQGFALEILPLLHIGRPTSLRDYQNSLWARIRNNLQLSIGTARATGDSADTDVGIGLRLTLFDAGDALADRGFVAKVDSAMALCAPTGVGNAPPVSVDQAAVERCMGGKLKALVDTLTAKSWNSLRWNASALAVAVAVGSRLTESRFSERRALGWRAWGTYAQRVSTWGHLLLHTAIEDNRAGGPDSSFKAATGGLRLLVGGSSLNGFVEVTQQKKWDTKAAIEKSPASWSGGLEFPVAKDLWISTGIGKAYEQVKGPDRVQLFANIKWGISGKSRLDPR
ncbi:MAG: hypothetical protein HOP28_15880 [Gemmatimonadales bacterium]|nr:hypothetical protein [Gemmatimonadales bacterium]